MAALLIGCTSTVVLPADTPTLPPEVDESSGLVRSRQHPGVFWTLNDSGGAARLYAVTSTGHLLRAVDVEGATNVDWEDLAVDDAGNLWVGDIGNNRNRRRDLVVYRVPEPDPAGDGPARVAGAVRFHYPEQTAFPMPGRRNFDAEALFWWDDTLWLFTKHRSDQATALYRFPAVEGEVALERVGELQLGGDPDRYGGMATAADVDPTGRHLALLTYHALFVLDRPDDGRSWHLHPRARVALDQDVAGQCEAVAWDGWSVVFTNEAGALFRIADPFHAEAWPPTGSPTPPVAR